MASTAYPPWVLLEHCGDDDGVGSFSGADATTLVTARTSTGHRIGVSLRLAAPLATSSICVHFPRGVKNTNSSVLAAHGDSVLICVYFSEGYDSEKAADYFVYNAGTAAADPPRPPSLSLLPQSYLTKEELENLHIGPIPGTVRRWLDRDGTGLLRRGDDEMVVAELKIVGDTPELNEAKLILLRSGLWNWSIERPAVIHSDRKDNLLSSWTAHTVLPVGDEWLCWVDLYDGLLFCNVFDEVPVLQHVPVPEEAVDLEPVTGSGSDRGVCVTSNGKVKFVGTFPRCCCGGTGSTHCKRSLHAYTINIWTLRIDGMVWEKDGMVDSSELWALSAYGGIPRVPPVRPILSLDDPHKLCFIVCEWYHVRDGGDETTWLIFVDTRKKALLSVSCHTGGPWITIYGELLPSKISCYFGSIPRISNGASSWTEGHMDFIPSSPIVVIEEVLTNDAGNSAWSSCKLSDEPALQGSEFLEAFLEISRYGFNRDYILKAYSILSDDNGRRFRSLLGLPKNLRKDWLLMEIKASQG
ncbi:unnamed protein product [Urochloa humidicola]